MLRWLVLRGSNTKVEICQLLHLLAPLPIRNGVHLQFYVVFPAIRWIESSSLPSKLMALATRIVTILWCAVGPCWSSHFLSSGFIVIFAMRTIGLFIQNFSLWNFISPCLYLFTFWFSFGRSPRDKYSRCDARFVGASVFCPLQPPHRIHSNPLQALSYQLPRGPIIFHLSLWLSQRQQTQYTFPKVQVTSWSK